MNQENAANTVMDIFAKSIAQAYSHHSVEAKSTLLPEEKLTSSVKKAILELEHERAASKENKSPTILECANDYLADRSTTGHITSKTARENLAIIKLVVRIIGNKAIDEITYQDMLAVRQTLIQLPPNLNKRPEYRELSIGQILDLKPGRVLSTRSCNKYLSRFSSFLNWCQTRGIISINPFRGCLIKEKKKVSAARKPFSCQDLQLLFSKENFQFKPKDQWKSFIMLLGLTGMRLEEICQLHCNDILTVDGIPSIDINRKGDKRLKNASSERIIPILSLLLSEQIDFLSFVAKQAAFSERLFPALRKMNGSYGHSYSKWFKRYRESCGITAPGKVFHSFRHTVATSLKNLDAPVYLASEILGHSVFGETYARYGKESPVKKMKRVMDLLSYGGISPTLHI